MTLICLCGYALEHPALAPFPRQVHIVGPVVWISHVIGDRSWTSVYTEQG